VSVLAVGEEGVYWTLQLAVAVAVPTARVQGDVVKVPCPLEMNKT